MFLLGQEPRLPPPQKPSCCASCLLAGGLRGLLPALILAAASHRPWPSTVVLQRAPQAQAWRRPPRFAPCLGRSASGAICCPFSCSLGPTAPERWVHRLCGVPVMEFEDQRGAVQPGSASRSQMAWREEGRAMSSCVPSLAGQVCPWEETDLLLCLPGAAGRT